MSEKHVILTDDTGKEIVSQLKKSNEVLAAMFQTGRAKETDWKTVNRCIVDGLGEKLFPVLTKLDVVATGAKNSVLNTATYPVRVLEHDRDFKYNATGEKVTPHTATVEFFHFFYNSRSFCISEKPYAITADKTFKAYKKYYTPVDGEYELFIKATANCGHYLAQDTYYELKNDEYVLTNDTYFVSGKEYYTKKYAVATVIAGGQIEQGVYYEKNQIKNVLHGNACWRDSLLRTWLNSDAEAGQWWKPANIFSIAPPEANTVSGFLYGLPEDFKKCLVATKIKTALSTAKMDDNENYFAVCDDDGEYSVEKRKSYSETEDKVFILSRSQIYATNNDESGQAYEFYRKYSDHTSPSGAADSNRIKTQVNNNHSSIAYLRDGNLTSTYEIFLLSASGSVGMHVTNSPSYRSVPCFVIGNNEYI